MRAGRLTFLVPSHPSVEESLGKEESIVMATTEVVHPLVYHLTDCPQIIFAGASFLVGRKRLARF